MPTHSHPVLALSLSLLIVACSRAPAPPPAPEPVAEPEPEIVEFPHEVVWTARPEVELRVDSARAELIPRPFTRLRVLEARRGVLVVRCEACATEATGEIGWDAIVYEPQLPASAAHGSLAEFALAVREAAARRDVEALRPVMARDFSRSLIGPPGRDPALAAWQAQEYGILDLVVELLDRGLASRDSRLWAAPPEHLETLQYRGYRLGFRLRPDDRWEWVFLLRGERP